MEIVAALFVEAIDFRKVEGDATRIDITGAFFSTAVPSYPAQLTPHLNKAMDTASMAMINLLQEKRKLSRIDAYALASMAMDCRLGPPTAQEREVHCLLKKSLWTAVR